MQSCPNTAYCFSDLVSHAGCRLEVAVRHSLAIRPETGLISTTVDPSPTFDFEASDTAAWDSSEELGTGGGDFGLAGGGDAWPVGPDGRGGGGLLGCDPP